MTTHNMRNVAIVAAEAYVTLKCAFDLEHGTGQQYTFIATKELASTLVVGDHVAARKANGDVVVVHVCEVHDDCDIDLDASWNYQFAFQKVDTHVLIDLEHDLSEKVKELNRRRRESIRRSAVAQAMREIGVSSVTELGCSTGTSDKADNI